MCSSLTPELFYIELNWSLLVSAPEIFDSISSQVRFEAGIHDSVFGEWATQPTGIATSILWYKTACFLSHLKEDKCLLVIHVTHLWPTTSLSIKSTIQPRPECSIGSFFWTWTLHFREGICDWMTWRVNSSLMHITSLGCMLSKLRSYSVLMALANQTRTKSQSWSHSLTLAKTKRCLLITCSWPTIYGAMGYFTIFAVCKSSLHRSHYGTASSCSETECQLYLACIWETCKFIYLSYGWLRVHMSRRLEPMFRLEIYLTVVVVVSRSWLRESWYIYVNFSQRHKCSRIGQISCVGCITLIDPNALYDYEISRWLQILIIM